MPMITDDELHGIKRMRASGHTHQEIADSLNLKRSTVAYQLKKLKDKPENSSIEMIHASNFTPKETLIEFDVHGFERHRMKNTLYTTGVKIFEMREGVIHKTSMRRGFAGGDYPRLVTLIQKYGRSWYREMIFNSGSAESLVNSMFHYDYANEYQKLKGKLEFLGLDAVDFNLYATKYVADSYREVVRGLPPIPRLLNPAMADEYMEWVNENRKPYLWLKKMNHSAWAIPDSVDNKIGVLRYLNEMDIEFSHLERTLTKRAKEQVGRLQKKLGFERLFEGTEWVGSGPKHHGAPEAYHIHRRNNARKIINERMEKRMPKMLIEYYKEKGIDKKDIPKLAMEPNPSGWPPEINHGD